MNSNPQISIVVMCYNEGATLADVVHEIGGELEKLGSKHEILIIDDGSTDETPRIARSLEEDNAHVRVVTHPRNRGLGGVYRSGFNEARGDCVSFFPADGQYPANVLPRFVQAIDDHDIVLGYLAERRKSLLGHLLSSIERVLYFLLLGPMPKFQGILMFRRKLLEDIPLGSDGRGWAILMEFILKISRRGYRITHALTPLRARSHGQSKVNNLRTICANVHLLFGVRKHLAPEDQATDFWRLSRQRRLFAGKKARWALLLAGLISIPLWQMAIGDDPASIDRSETQKAASGMHDEDRFVYLLHYLDQFPVATEHAELKYSQNGAKRLVEEHGETLLMELGHTIRGGDLLRTYLYLPSAWLYGPKKIALRPFHGFVFIVSLLSLFLVLWWIKQPILAIAMPILIGSHPLQTYEVWGRENIFGWPITVVVFLLAIHIPLIFKRELPRWYPWVAAIIAACLIATVKEIRTEAALAGMGVVFVYLFCIKGAYIRRFAILACFIVVGMGVNTLWESYFNSKWEEAKSFVIEAGGHPYEGPRVSEHYFWHAIWCGLGDFGTDRGYVWKDQAAHAYAEPILESEYGITIPSYQKKGHQVFKESFWDPGMKYYKVTVEFPHYSEVVRAKVLGDIADDPAWYAGILAKRAWRILAATAPIRLQWAGDHVDVPLPRWWGILVLPLLAFLLLTRNWPLVQLLIFSLPLSLAALLIFSGKGMTHFALFPHIIAALLIALLVELLMWIKSRGGDLG